MNIVCVCRASGLYIVLWFTFMTFILTLIIMTLNLYPAFRGKFLNAGQVCVAPDYILVHRKVHDKFIATMKATIAKAYTASPSTSPDLGG